MTSLYWLPELEDWRGRLRALASDVDGVWTAANRLAGTRLDFVRTNALDEMVRRLLGDEPPSGLATKPVRLALLGAGTLAHLHAGIRVAGLRRGIHISTYENDYGQYWQEIANSGSALHAFSPNTVLLSLDGYHLTAGVDAAMPEEAAAALLQETIARIRGCWRMLHEAFGCHIIHQLPLPVHQAVLGNNEHRLPGSRSTFIARLCNALRLEADAAGVDLLTLDTRASLDGIRAWHDAGLWHRAKQEVSPAAAPMYGELVGRLVAAKQGRSFKCLVLDLDNTLWGGVVGDDGIGRARARAGQRARRGLCGIPGLRAGVVPAWRHPCRVLEERRGQCA